MKYTLHKNGRWDISGTTIQLRNAYPAIDGRPVSPIRVSVQEDSILYELGQGRLELLFKENGNETELACRLSGAGPVHDIEPLGDAVVLNGSSAFVQGFGMEGPSGLHNLTEDSPLLSNGLIALTEESSAFFVFARDHRHYVNRYRIRRDPGLFGEDVSFLSGGFNLENTAKADLLLPSLFFSEEPALIPGLEACAQKIADEMGARTSQPPAFHWCSWYYLYQNLTQELLEEYLDGFQKEAADFRYVQIDAGYAPSLGDWLIPNHRFPQGLKKAAETILHAGYRPGIWIGPFIVADGSKLYRSHPDWILRHKDGTPVTQLQSYNEPKLWGNPDCNYYVLDTSHPEALGYLRQVFRTLKEWGFSLYKTDFMLWSMYDTAAVKRYDSSLTSVEIFRNTLQMIREEIGEDSYLLGCIAPFLPFIGYADGMRIAGDVGAQWAGAYGPVNMLRELEADNYFNHIYWQNDPDSVLLRDFDLFLQPQEIRSLALLQALSGGAVTTSDPLHRLPEDRLELLRFIQPKDRVRPQFPYYGTGRREIVLLHRLRQGNLLYLMNPTDQPLPVICRFGELFEKDSWHIWEYGHTFPSKEEKSSLYAEVLPPHGCALLFLTEKPLAKEPQNLWRWGEED